MDEEEEMLLYAGPDTLLWRIDCLRELIDMLEPDAVVMLQRSMLKGAENVMRETYWEAVAITWMTRHFIEALNENQISNFADRPLS